MAGPTGWTSGSPQVAPTYGQPQSSLGAATQPAMEQSQGLSLRSMNGARRGRRVQHGVRSISLDATRAHGGLGLYSGGPLGGNSPDRRPNRRPGTSAGAGEMAAGGAQVEMNARAQHAPSARPAGFGGSRMERLRETARLDASFAAGAHSSGSEKSRDAETRIDLRPGTIGSMQESGSSWRSGTSNAQAAASRRHGESAPGGGLFAGEPTRIRKDLGAQGGAPAASAGLYARTRPHHLSERSSSAESRHLPAPAGSRSVASPLRVVPSKKTPSRLLAQS